METVRLNNFLQSVGISANKRSQIIGFFLESLRSSTYSNLQESTQPVKELKDKYAGLIVEMFQKHPALESQVYIDYINLLFDKLLTREDKK